MKKINWNILFISIALMGFTFLNSSCGKEESKDHEETEMHENHDEGHHDHGENGEMDGEHHEDLEYDVDDEEAQVVVTKYLMIKEALVNTDPAGAAEAANALIEEAKGMEAGPGMDSLLVHVEVIASTADVEKQREIFAHLTEHVYEMLEDHDPGMTLYKQFCPMAFDNEGASWLSDKEEILNPYFGDKMLHCGSVTEVITEK